MCALYLLSFPLVVVTRWSPPPIGTSAAGVVKVDVVLSTNTASPAACILIKYYSSLHAWDDFFSTFFLDKLGFNIVISEV